MNKSELKKGCIYFGLRFEDDACTQVLVHSFEYLGVNVYGPAPAGEEDQFCFRRMGSEDTLEVTERQLNVMLRLGELTKALEKWARENPSLPG